MRQDSFPCCPISHAFVLPLTEHLLFIRLALEDDVVSLESPELFRPDLK